MRKEKIFFENSKGLKLCGILEEPKEEKEEVVIIVHGYSSNKNRPSSEEMAEELTKKKINSFRIDLDGCGESEGDFAEQTITSAVDDINSAIGLMKGRGYQKIDLFGSSAGGLAVMATAIKHPEINKVGLKAPVSDFASQRREKLGEEGIKKWKEQGYTYYLGSQGKNFRVNYSFYEDIQKYVMYDQVKEIKCPVLVIHGEADETVKVEQSRKLVKNFPDGKLIVLKGADHSLAIKEDRSLAKKLFGDWFEGKEVFLPK